MDEEEGEAPDEDEDRRRGERQVLVPDQGAEDGGHGEDGAAESRLQLADQTVDEQRREKRLGRVLHAGEDEADDVAGRDEQREQHGRSRRLDAAVRDTDQQTEDLPHGHDRTGSREDVQKERDEVEPTEKRERREEERPDDAGGRSGRFAGVDAVMTRGNPVRKCEVDVGVIQRVDEDPCVGLQDARVREQEEAGRQSESCREGDPPHHVATVPRLFPTHRCATLSCTGIADVSSGGQGGAGGRGPRAEPPSSMSRDARSSRPPQGPDRPREDAPPARARDASRSARPPGGLR